MSVGKANERYGAVALAPAAAWRSRCIASDRQGATAVSSSGAVAQRGQAPLGAKLGLSGKSVFSWLVSGKNWISDATLAVRQFASALATKNLLISALLMALVLGSGVMTVYSVQLNRQLFTELKVLQAVEDRAQSRWTQLLLEESALSAPAHVEHIASTRLGMAAPRTEQVEMVR